MNTVDFADNYDGTQQEPRVLPARLPNMLLNGASGIAVGMATNIPPHNLNELAGAICYLIDHWDGLDEVSVDELMQFVTGPDFPTGAEVVANEALKEAYATGRGHIVIRARILNEIGKNDRHRLVITDIPYQVSKTLIIERIVALVKEDKLNQIADLRDESDRQGMRLVIELKHGANPDTAKKQLFKYTQLQSTYGIQMLALVNGEPRTLSLKRMLQIYVEHRYEVIVRRSQFELEKRRGRAHILEGLLKALSSLDAIIQTIRSAEDTEDARNKLVSRFGLSEAQASAILEMQLRRLAALEQLKLQQEFNEVMTRIAYLEDLLASPPKILAVIREDVVRLTEDYGDTRRTSVIYGENVDLSEADLIVREEVVVLLSEMGYIKRVPANAYKSQRRGGKGVIGFTTKGEDAVTDLVSCSSHDRLLFFTDKGKVYSTAAWNIPEAARAGKGILIHSVIAMGTDEHITAIVPVDSFDKQGYFVLATKNARIKRVELEEFEAVRPSGLIAMNLDEGDLMQWAKYTDGDQDIVLVTEGGQSIRFHERRVRVMGRPAGGVKSIRLYEDDVVAGMDVIDAQDTHVVIVTSRGYGKRTPLEEYREQGRHGLGIRTMSRDERLGPIVSMHCVSPQDDILLLTRQASVLRTNLEQIREVGRNARGVRMMALDKDDEVVGVAIMRAEESVDPIEDLNGDPLPEDEGGAPEDEAADAEE